MCCYWQAISRYSIFRIRIFSLFASHSTDISFSCNDVFKIFFPIRYLSLRTSFIASVKYVGFLIWALDFSLSIYPLCRQDSVGCIPRKDISSTHKKVWIWYDSELHQMVRLLFWWFSGISSRNALTLVVLGAAKVSSMGWIDLFKIHFYPTRQSLKKQTKKKTLEKQQHKKCKNKCHHNHGILPRCISLTLSSHSSLLSSALGRSSILHPVSVQNCAR